MRALNRSTGRRGPVVVRHPVVHRAAIEALESRLLLIASQSQNYTITVNDNADKLDNPANTLPSQLGASVTLRDAINAANTAQGVTTIVLAKTTYDFTTVDNNWYGPNALPPIDSNIIIQGNGATLQRDSSLPQTTAGAFRFIYVSGGIKTELPLGTLTLSNLTLTNGLAKGGNSLTGGGGGGMGGAIFNQGDTTLSGVTLYNNTALGGSSGDVSLADYSEDPGSDYTLQAATGGGGIGQDAPFDNSDTQNSAGGFGGNFPAGVYGGKGTDQGTGGGFDADGQDDTGGGYSGLGGDSVYGQGLGGDGGSAELYGEETSQGGDFGFGGQIEFIGAGTYQQKGGGGGVGGGGATSNDNQAPGGDGGFGGGGGSTEYLFPFVGPSTLSGGDGGFGGGGGAGGSPNSDGLGDESVGLGGFGGGNGASYPADEDSGGGGAGMGGAIFSMYGSLTVVNSTLTANTAKGGDGFDPYYPTNATAGSGYGGAIFNLDGSADIESSTIADNTVTGGQGAATDRSGDGNADGGALYNIAYGSNYDTNAGVTAAATINNSILYGTVGGTNDLVNTEFDGNYNTQDFRLNPPVNTGNVASVTSTAPNVIGASTNSPGNAPTHLNNGTPGTATLDLPGVISNDPKLAALADNGGPTETMALGTGSSAIDAGSNAAIPSGITTDQRGSGYPRIVNGTVDIGAFEAASAAITTTPVVTLTAPSNGGSTNNNKPTFSGDAGTASGDSTTVTIKIYSGSTASGSPLQTQTATANGGTYSVTATAVLSDGTYTAVASQANTDGNTGTSSPATFTVDTVAPYLTMTAPTNGADLINHSPVFTGEAGFYNSDSATITVNVYTGTAAVGTPLETLTATRTGQVYSVAASPALPGGTFTAQAIQADAAGNVGKSSANTFTIANATTPIVTLLSPSNGSSTNNNKPTFSGAAGTASGDSTTITIKIYSGSTASGSPVQTLSATASGGTYSVTATAALSDGTFTAVASQANTDGNTGTSSANTFTIDTVAPIVTLTSPANGGSTNTTSPTFTGSAGTAAGDLATITIKIYPGSTISGSPVQTLTTVASGGSYSVTPTAPLETGTYTAVATQSDAAGNTGTSTANTFTTGSAVTPPPPSTGSLAGSSSVATSTYNLTTLGTGDWAAFGVNGNFGSYDHKATGGSQISKLNEVGNSTFGAFNDDTGNRSVSWTDGTPQTSNSHDTGFAWVNNSLGTGYSFTAPADTTSRTLYIYLGGFSSGSTLVAHLSDGSDADVSMNFSGAGKYNELAAITYSAASANQHLILTYTKTSNINGTGGSADIMAAWLGGAPVTPKNVAPQVTSNPTNQSVTAGQTVTFTAGASGTPMPTVQWQVSTDGGIHFADVSGATSTTLSFTTTLNESGYKYRAVFTNSVNTATSTVATLTVTPASTPTGGSLVGSSSPAATSYNLSTLGTSDWAKFGRAGNASGFDHKSSGGSQISNVTRVGNGSFGGYVDDTGTRNVSWTAGTPDASATNDHGFLWANNGIGTGYSFTAPADTTTRTIYVYLGGFSSGATLTAHLSDGSAADYTVSFSGTGKYNDVVAITYKAVTAGTHLVLTYVKSQNINGTAGSADLMAAWLA